MNSSPASVSSALRALDDFESGLKNFQARLEGPQDAASAAIEEEERQALQGKLDGLESILKALDFLSLPVPIPNSTASELTAANTLANAQLSAMEEKRRLAQTAMQNFIKNRSNKMDSSK